MRQTHKADSTLQEVAIKRLTGKFNHLLAATMISGSLLSPFAAMAQDDSSAPPANDNAVAAQSVTPDNGNGDKDGAAAGGADLFDQSWLQAQGSPIDFENPQVLFGWPVALLLLWIALRSMPIRPKDVEFAPIFILEELETLETEPDQMKWLEKMIWMGALTGAFFGAADPQLNPQPDFAGDGPIVIAADTGFAAAPNWEKHRDAMREVIRHAYNDGRNVVFLNMAHGEDGQPVSPSEPMNAAKALSYLENMSPVPWETDRDAALAALSSLSGNYGASYWMTNGLDDERALDFAVALDQLAPLTVYDESNKAHLMMTPQYANGNYNITVMRAGAGKEETLRISAYDPGHNSIGSVTATFPEGENTAIVTFDPRAYDVAADRIFSFSIDNEVGAGAITLVSENYKPRTVGIAARGGQDDTGSLLSEGRFLYAALEPYTDIEFGNLEKLLDGQDISVLIVPDAVPITGVARDKLQRWVESGGMLGRFAGENLAADNHADDPLLPIDIRKGIRTMAGGVATGANGLGLEQFSGETPFAGMSVDESVRIDRGIVTQPSSGGDPDVWARLSDGTSVVTAAERGAGRVVLYHTTANAAWSDLPLSANFVDMLVATVGQSNSVEDTSDYKLPVLPPISVLNGKGEVRSPTQIVAPLTQDVVDQGLLGPEHRPGLYGSTLMTVPYNVSDAVDSIEMLRPLPDSINRDYYKELGNKDKVKGWLWSGAIMLTLLGGFVIAGHNKLWGHRNKKRKDVAEKAAAHFRP